MIGDHKCHCVHDQNANLSCQGDDVVHDVTCSIWWSFYVQESLHVISEILATTAKPVVAPAKAEPAKPEPAKIEPAK